MTKIINPGMFTDDNAKRFEEKVEPADKNGCQLWNGSTTKYPGKKGVRHFGLFRISGSGYVMNQRFAFVYYKKLTEEKYGIKVEPIPSCKLQELCCNPEHIQPKAKKEKPARSQPTRLRPGVVVTTPLPPAQGPPVDAISKRLRGHRTTDASQTGGRKAMSNPIRNKQKAQRGGAREGAGKKPLFGERMTQMTITIPDTDSDFLIALGNGSRSAGVRAACEELRKNGRRDV
jgi:hypothetical protein